MTRRFVWLMLLLLALGVGELFVPESAGAQAIDANIIGQVTDPGDLPLPGVTVTVSSLALQVRQLSATTDDRGEYRFSSLPIGTYQISYVLDGFQAVRREDIRLTSGFTARLNIKMQLGGLEETITVSGSSPVVDVTSSSSVTTLTRETLEVLPTSRDGVQAILVQTPGARTNIDVGGDTTGAVPQTTLYGRDSQPWITMEGVYTSSPTVRQSGNYQDYNMMEEVAVRTYAHDADVGTPGLALTTALKSGGNTFHGESWWTYTNTSLQSNNVTDELARAGISEGRPILARWDLSGNLSGYIVRDRMWFAGGFRSRINDTGILNCLKGPTGGGRHDTDQCEDDTETNFYTGRVSYQASQSNRFVGYYQRNLKDTLGRDVSALNPWTWRNRQDQNGDLAKAEWLATLGQSAVVQVFYGYWDFGYEFTNFDQSIATFDVFTRQNGGDRGVTAGLYARKQVSAKTQFYRPTEHLGNHDLKIGFDQFWSQLGMSAENRVSGNHRVVFNNGVPFQFNTYNYPYASANRSDYTAIYFHDQWRLASRTTLNLGVRYVRDDMFIPEQRNEGGQYTQPRAFDRVNFAVWNSLVPRAHVAYDLTGDAKTVVKGGWSRYAGMRDLGIANGINPNGNITTTYRWNDRNGDRVYQAGEVDLSYSGPDFVSVSASPTQFPNPDEKPYRDDEFSLSIEREIIRGIATRVLGIYTRETNVPRLLNTKRPYEAYNIPITRPIPGDDGVAPSGAPYGTITYYEFPTSLRGPDFEAPTIVNHEASDRSWTTLEIGLTKRMSHRWMAFSAFSTTKTDQPFIPYLSTYGGFRGVDNVGNGNLDPNQEIFSYDRTREWQVKLGAAFELPKGFTVATNYQALSGQPWAKTATFTGGVTVPSIVLRVEPLGLRRLPALHLIDARLERDFTLVGRHKMTLRLDAFNLPNLGTIQSQVVQLGPNFGQPLTNLPGRNLQFGLSYSF